MDGIMIMVKSLEESVLLIKGVSKTIKNEAKEQKEDLQKCYWALQMLRYQGIY